MDKKEITEIFENHLKVLAKAAKNQCSGEDLKAITKAMIMTEKKLDQCICNYSTKFSKTKIQS